jgi:DNA uptake protein ComE-like DNA-binding protein
MKRTTTTLACLGAATLLIAVAACGTDTDAADSTAAADSAAAATPAAPAGGATDSAANNGFLDPNTATTAQLAMIPSLDSATRAAIVAGRPYANMTAVDSVLARAKLSEAQRDTVYARLWKPIDLNTASDAEILLIPNMGPKMLHEFKEYRPYPQIEKFRREIGKYVDPPEVARLERYVFIP